MDCESPAHREPTTTRPLAFTEYQRIQACLRQQNWEALGLGLEGGSIKLRTSGQLSFKDTSGEKPITGDALNRIVDLLNNALGSQLNGQTVQLNSENALCLTGEEPVMVSVPSQGTALVEEDIATATQYTEALATEATQTPFQTPDLPLDHRVTQMKSRLEVLNACTFTNPAVLEHELEVSGAFFVDVAHIENALRTNDKGTDQGQLIQDFIAFKRLELDLRYRAIQNGIHFNRIQIGVAPEALRHGSYRIDNASQVPSELKNAWKAQQTRQGARFRGANQAMMIVGASIGHENFRSGKSTTSQLQVYKGPVSSESTGATEYPQPIRKVVLQISPDAVETAESEQLKKDRITRLLNEANAAIVDLGEIVDKPGFKQDYQKTCEALDFALYGEPDDAPVLHMERQLERLCLEWPSQSLNNFREKLIEDINKRPLLEAAFNRILRTEQLVEVYKAASSQEWKEVLFALRRAGLAIRNIALSLDIYIDETELLTLTMEGQDTWFTSELNSSARFGFITPQATREAYERAWQQNRGTEGPTGTMLVLLNKFGYQDLRTGEVKPSTAIDCMF